MSKQTATTNHGKTSGGRPARFAGKSSTASRRQRIAEMSLAPRPSFVEPAAATPTRRGPVLTAAVAGLCAVGALAFIGLKDRHQTLASADAAMDLAAVDTSRAWPESTSPTPVADAPTESGLAAFDPGAYATALRQVPVAHVKAEVHDVAVAPAPFVGEEDVETIYLEVTPGEGPLAPTPLVEDAPVADAALESDTEAIAADVIDENALVEGDGTVRLLVAGTTIVKTRRPLSRVSVGSADVAEVNTLSPETVLITAKKAGETQLILWDDDQESQAIQVIVEPDLGGLQRVLDENFPSTDVRVTPVNNAIGLSGRVGSLMVAQQIGDIAAQYGPVLNMLEIGGGQQVMLKVRFAEVSRNLNKQLGINFAFSDGATVIGSNVAAASQFGILGNLVTAPEAIGVGPTIFGGHNLDNGNPFRYFVNALKDANLLRMLSEPSVVVVSGSQGSILAGGEIPVPVPNENGVAIVYKEFGVRLDYTPTVLGDGRIRLELEPRSSELDYSIAVQVLGTLVPGTRTREVSTTVEMAPGQTLVIGGLLSESVVANRQAVPVLGELPILGALFRSVRYQRQETELVVMIEPTLVAPVDPARKPHLPGETWEHPTDAELFGYGDLGHDPRIPDRQASGDRLPPEPAAGAPVFAEADTVEPAAATPTVPEPAEEPAPMQAIVATPTKTEPRQEPRSDTPAGPAKPWPLPMNVRSGSAGQDVLVPVTDDSAGAPKPTIRNAVPVDVIDADSVRPLAEMPTEPLSLAPVSPFSQPTMEVRDTTVRPVVKTPAAIGDDYRQETTRAKDVVLVEQQRQTAKPVRQLELPFGMVPVRDPSDTEKPVLKPQANAPTNPQFIGGFGFDD